MQKETVIIIGGGPAGLSAAIYAARADLKPFVIAGAPPGGQLTLTSEVENYPGRESILGPELIQNMRDHARHFETRFLNDNVKSVDFADPKELKLTVSSGDEYAARAVLIATGAEAMWLNLPSEQKLRGRGVSACATCDAFFFKNKQVAVVGGGDTAMEEALTLTKFAERVYIIHRRDEFRASRIMQKRVLENKKIDILWGTSVEEVLGEERVEGLKISHTTNTSKDKVKDNRLKIDGLFLGIGHKPSTDFLKDSGVHLNRKGYVSVASWFAWHEVHMDKKDRDDEKNNNSPTSSQSKPQVNTQPQFESGWQYVTTKKGVFAAGDCVDYLYRQAVTAAGMGVAAILEVERYLSELQ